MESVRRRRVLHITRATLYKRLKKYNITVQREAPGKKVLPQNKAAAGLFLLLAVYITTKRAKFQVLQFQRRRCIL